MAGFLLWSCSGDQKKLDVSEKDIDAYVEAKLQPDEIYEIQESGRFSREVEAFTEAYQCVSYKQNDTVVLITESDNNKDRMINRNIYFMEGLPVFIEEMIFGNPEKPVENRKVYLNGVDVIAAYTKYADYEEEIEATEFTTFELSAFEFDFDRPLDAIAQRGDYEMKFGEFIVMPESQYLILENKKSEYDVALLIFESDELILQLFENPGKYRGKTVKFRHEFVLLYNVMQMKYLGGEVMP